MSSYVSHLPAEVTDGMVITRMRLNGDSVSLGPAAAAG